MVSMILCVDSKGGIGKDGGLPWYIPSEMKHFRERTLFSTVIMGRKTWESLPYKLDSRAFIVVSNTLEAGPQKLIKKLSKKDPIDYEVDVLVAPTLHSAINHDNPFIYRPLTIIGGAGIYQEALAYGLPDCIYLSVLPDDYNCDTFVDVSDERLSSMGYELIHETDYTEYKFKIYKLGAQDG